MNLYAWSDYTAVIDTSKGEIRIDLFEIHAPKTVNNFAFLSEEGFYDGLTFHRVIEDFVIQGGDPLGDGTGGPGYTFDDEISPKYSFDEPYIVAMANSGSNSNGSQFFITTKDSDADYLTGDYTIFGKVISGQEVVDSIEKVSTNEKNKPVEDILIKSVSIEKNFSMNILFSRYWWVLLFVFVILTIVFIILYLKNSKK
ncbi:MAG TPA: peptidylprolyl isomerase [bacterium]|nr:peptidylprolyl isomerase [bacterium]